MRRLLLLALVLFGGLTLIGQPQAAGGQQPLPSATITATDASTAGLIRVVLEVVDAAGRPVPGMVAEQFRARLQGADAPIKQVTPVTDAGLPIDVVLALDTSGSMAGAPLDQARAAARAFVAGLAPADRVAVLSFGDAVLLVQDFTADRAAVNRALDSLTAEGNTALYQATAESVARAGTGVSTRRAVILLSDGVDYGGRSRVTREEALDQAARQGIPVFTIGLGSEIDADYLSILASRTSGQYLAAPSADALARLYEGIGARLRGQYVLTLDASGLDLSRPVTVHVEALPLGAPAPAVAETTLQPAIAQPLTLAVSGVGPGETVDGDRTVTVAASGGSLVSVVYRLDGVATAAAGPPFEYRVSGLAEGAHRLEIEAVSADGQRATTTLEFTSVAPPAATSGTPAAISWALIPIAVAAFATAGILYVRARRRARQRALAAAHSATERTRRGEGTVPAQAESEPAAEAPEGGDVAPDEEAVAPCADAPVPVIPAGEPARSKLLAMMVGEEPPPPPAFPEEPLGVVIAVGGPLAGQRFPVGATPIAVGSGYRCHVRLPVEAADAGVEEVRVWVRRGRLMYHRVARLRAVPDEWTGPEWLVVEAGEQFDIGRQAFRFELSEPAEDAFSPDQDPAAGEEPAGSLTPERPVGGQERVSHPPRRRPRKSSGKLTELDVSILREDSRLRQAAHAPDPDEPAELTDEDFEGADI